MPIVIQMCRDRRFLLGGLSFAACALSSILIGHNLFAAQEQTSTMDTGPVIVSTASLTQREQTEAGRTYTYQYRGKSKLLNPYISGTGGISEAEEPAARPLTEEEKLYRYFGAATKFYEEGKYEEAIEILKFIVGRDPGNEYVKNYLQKAVTADNAQERRYEVGAKQDAIALRRSKVKLSLKNGIDLYKQKRYDMALAEFSDALELDPNNWQAKHYMAKLKEHYAKEGRIERMISVQKGEASRTDEDSKGPAVDFASEGQEGLKAAAQALMDRGEMSLDGKKVQDIKDIESLTFAEKNNSLLEQAELGLTIDEIIARQREEAYKTAKMTISLGDVILVTVYDHNELSGQCTVGPRGDVILPLVGVPITVKGLTTDEASEKIKEEMSRYVKDPIVVATIISTSKLFYFIDEVGCTPYPINRSNFTLRDALFLSDWGSNRALGRVIVIRPDKIRPIITKVDAFDLIYRGNLAVNVAISDGDIVYVPQTVAGKTTQTLSDTISPFTEVISARDAWLNLKWTHKGLNSIPKIYDTRIEMPPEAQAAAAH